MALKPDFSHAKWRKSGVSSDGGCVEVAYSDGFIGVRDTKDSGTGPILAFNKREWVASSKAQRRVNSPTSTCARRARLSASDRDAEN